MKYDLINKKKIFILDESFGGEILAGNKFRKSNYLLKSFKKSGIITMGSEYSNHSLAIAYFANFLNKNYIYLLVRKKKLNIQKYPNLIYQGQISPKQHKNLLNSKRSFY